MSSGILKLYSLSKQLKLDFSILVIIKTRLKLSPCQCLCVLT